jgi:transposase
MLVCFPAELRMGECHRIFELGQHPVLIAGSATGEPLLRCLAFCGQSNSLFSKERMDGPMARTQPKKIRSRRFFSEEFKQEAVQMLLDGHSAPSVAERLGLPGPNVLYRWKRETLRRAGPAARTLGDRVAQLEEELRRVERERDILKKALAILSRQG